MSLPLSPDLARRKITNEQLRVGDRWRLSWDAGQRRDEGCLPSCWGFTLTPEPGAHLREGISGVRADPAIYWPPSVPADTYRIYDGTDENGIVGTVAPGLFAQEGRCWRMIHENPVGHGTHCMESVAWVGRWKFLDGRTEGVELRATGR